MTSPINGGPAGPASPLKRLAWAAGGLILCFAWPFYNLARFSLGSELYSHIVLIPFISLYLGWLKRDALLTESAPNRPVGIFLLAGGVSMLAVVGLKAFFGTTLAPEDSLALTTLSFVLLLAGLGGLFLGRQAFRALAFPFGFLVFMVPLPMFLLGAVETFLQHGSASVSGAMFNLVGTPVFREELVLRLPGIVLQVAPECSGIHSTLALFITSVLGGYFFLRSPVSRAVLALAVIPLALLRNGLRIFTVGELCVQISPDMIDSYIHRHGGPIFFALSLVPFSLLLFALIKVERRFAAR